MRFSDAGTAGRALAARLGAYAGREDAVVIAVARGGVGVGLAVSAGLGLPLDLLLLRRLLVPRGPDEPVCAADVAGTPYLDAEVASILGGGRGRGEASEPDPGLRHFLADALAEFDAHARACRGARRPLDLAGKTALLVDNGVSTGSTMRAAVRAVRSRVPARVVAAAPVVSTAGRAAVGTVADEVVCLASPEPFGHVGLWYADFTRPNDDEILRMLDERKEEGRSRQ
jgi:putative phosphoribosyl transferase